MMKVASIFGGVIAFLAGCNTFAQSSGTIHGSVSDPSGAVIAGAAVEIQNPVSHYDQTTKTDTQGNFSFANVPFNPYHVSVSATGFQTTSQDVDVRSAIPLELKVNLQIGAATKQQ